MRFLFIPFLLFAFVAAAQEKFTISGYVKDTSSGETVIGANISIQPGNESVTSNQYGYYSITLPAGDYQFTISHVSYLQAAEQISLTSNIRRDILLLSRNASMNEVIVYSKKRDANVKNAQMGKIELSMDQIKAIPSFMGEVDILKTIQLLPGVRNAGEGNAGFYVRGGGPDQNLILLDDAVVYNTGHLFGFFSIFNADAIKNTSLIKGGMPAQYGGRLSSVLDVAMKDGNNQQYIVEGGIGLIASRFSVQGPIQKNKSSFIVSGRRTYVDALVKPFISKESEFHGSGYYFYDLNVKFNHRFSQKDRIFLSGYFGRDVFDFVSGQQSFKANIPWGNTTASFRWNHVFSQKLFANTSLVYNDYQFSFGAEQNNLEIKLSSGIRDGSFKYDMDYYPAPHHKLKFGLLSTYHKFIPNVVSGRQDSVVFTPGNEDIKYALENGFYGQDDWELSDKIAVNYGVRWSRFAQIGPYTRYTRDQDQNKIDSTKYKSFETIRGYGGIEPRVTLRWSVDDKTSIKGSVSRNLQYIHLVSNSGTTLPTDLWVPSTFRVEPQLSWLYAAGFFRNFKDNSLETSIELYYKSMQNQIEFKEGYQPGLTDPEADFVFGKGWSYGSEFLVNKVKGDLTGWIGYTLSWTWRKFDQLNTGLKYPAKFDRRHDLSVVATYKFNSKWQFGSVFVYGTGNATTLPERFYFINGVLTQEYSSLNQYRLKAYHRLDLSATYRPVPKKKRKVESYWVFSVYNVYNRMNPYFIYFDQKGSAFQGTLEIEAKQVSLFPVLPSVTWNFRF
jgi:hypothetical protein